MGEERDFTCSPPAGGRSGSLRASAGGEWGGRTQPPRGDSGVSPLGRQLTGFFRGCPPRRVRQPRGSAFIYYLFHLVAAPTSASCYKKRSTAGLGALPAASEHRGGKGPARAAAHPEGACRGCGAVRARLCPACPLPAPTGYQLGKKSIKIFFMFPGAFSVMLHRAGLKVPDSARPSSSARLGSSAAELQGQVSKGTGFF